MISVWDLIGIGRRQLALIIMLLGVMAAGGKALGQNRWNWRNPVPQGSSLNAVIYGDGHFLAVGEAGIAMTSPDGSAWTTQATGINKGLYSVAQGNGITVAVGEKGTIIRSLDAVHWTFGQAGTNEPLRGITFANGVFAAVGGDSSRGLILTSADGIDWTTRASDVGYSFCAVTYGNGRFVAVGQLNLIWTSTDGITWAASPLSGGDYSLNTITYGNGLFVAGGYSGVILSSPDGQTWTRRTSNTSDNIYSISYGAGKFSGAVSSSGFPNPSAVFSTDGVNWTNESVPLYDIGLKGIASGGISDTSVFVGQSGVILSTRDRNAWNFHAGPATTPQIIARGDEKYVGFWYKFSATATSPGAWTFHRQAFEFLDLTYGNGLFAAVTSTSIYTSTDGITWNRPYTGLSPTITSGHSIRFSNGRFIATGIGKVVVSSDGVTWAESQTFGTLNGGAYANGTYVVVGGASNVSEIRTSPTGTSNWTLRATGAADGFTDVTFGNGLFVAVGYTGKIYTSPDGITWTSRVSGTTEYLKSVSWGNGIFTVGGEVGLLLTSPDGITWTNRVLPTAINLDIRFTGSKFICGGGQVLSSQDGNQWTFHSGLPAIDFKDVCYGAGQFVAAGRWTKSTYGASGIVTSPDGVTWTARATNRFWLSSVSFANGLYLAGGEAGRFLTSPDGITWTEKTVNGTCAIRRLTYGNGAYVAVGGSFGQAEIHRSVDGVTWTKQTGSVPANELLDVVFANGLFVATGGWSNGHAIATSADGITWTNQVLAGNSNYPLMSIAFGNGTFVTVGGYGRIATSTDGVNWATQVPVGNSFMDDIHDVVFANGRFVAIRGGTGEVLISPDGANWLPQNTNPSGSAALAYGPGVFVSVGSGSAILSSPLEEISAAPAGVALNPGSSRGIQVTWENVASETGYLIERRTEPNGSWQVVASALAAESTQFEDSNLMPGTTYSYRLRAIYAGGGSCYSDPITSRTFTISEQWRKDHFDSTADQGIGADNADPDNDGLPNLLERAFGLPPFETTRGGYFQIIKPGLAPLIRFTRDSANKDLIYEIESSTDLKQWTVIARSSGGNRLTSIGSGFSTDYEDPLEGTKILVTVALHNNPSIFHRLKVTRQ